MRMRTVIRCLVVVTVAVAALLFLSDPVSQHWPLTQKSSLCSLLCQKWPMPTAACPLFCRF